MRDGYTREVRTESGVAERLEKFLRQWQACVVLVSGSDAGTEYPLDGPATIVGRGASADLQFEDAALSSEHAAFEFADAGFRVRDLGSMNGTRHNGDSIRAAALENGDELRMGSQVFRFVLAERKRGPRTYQIPVD